MSLPLGILVVLFMMLALLPASAVFPVSPAPYGRVDFCAAFTAMHAARTADETPNLDDPARIGTAKVRDRASKLAPCSNAEYPYRLEVAHCLVGGCFRAAGLQAAPAESTTVAPSCCIVWA
jgi:hypothetical protein